MTTDTINRYWQIVVNYVHLMFRDALECLSTCIRFLPVFLLVIQFVLDQKDELHQEKLQDDLKQTTNTQQQKKGQSAQSNEKQAIIITVC